MKWIDHYGSWRGKQGPESLPCFRSDPNDQALREEGKEAGSQPLLCHYQAPLQSCSSLELKTSHLISKHAQNLTSFQHVVSLFLFLYSASWRISEKWKKCHLPQCQSAVLFSALKKKKETHLWREERSIRLGHTVLTPDFTKRKPFPLPSPCLRYGLSGSKEIS